jgi:hypothetical protein
MAQRDLATNLEFWSDRSRNDARHNNPGRPAKPYRRSRFAFGGYASPRFAFRRCISRRFAKEYSAAGRNNGSRTKTGDAPDP